jgi:hypothetical protein
MLASGRGNALVAVLLAEPFENAPPRRALVSASVAKASEPK